MLAEGGTRATRVQVVRKMSREYVSAGAAVDAVSPHTGCTAFHIACINDHADSAEALARAGCDVGIKAKSGWAAGADGGGGVGAVGADHLTWLFR